MDDLLRIAEIACEAAMRAGAHFADASADRGRGLSVVMERNAIKSSDARTWASVSVRAFVAGGTGWCSVSTTSDEAARQAGQQAAELAKAAEPDPDFVDLVIPAPYPEVGGLYDPKVAALEGPELARWVTQSIDSALGVTAEALVAGGAASLQAPYRGQVRRPRGGRL